MLKELLTDAQGVWDDARFHASLLVLAYIGCSIYAIYKGQEWNPQSFGAGAGFLATGIGAWFKLRGDK